MFQRKSQYNLHAVTIFRGQKSLIELLGKLPDIDFVLPKLRIPAGKVRLKVLILLPLMDNLDVRPFSTMLLLVILKFALSQATQPKPTLTATSSLLRLFSSASAPSPTHTKMVFSCGTSNSITSSVFNSSCSKLCTSSTWNWAAPGRSDACSSRGWSAARAILRRVSPYPCQVRKSWVNAAGSAP